MTPPEVRLSPDGKNVAIRNLHEYAGSDGRYAWRGTGGAWLTDADVARWTPLLPVSTPERATCPECGRDGRALDPQGRIRWHFGKGPDHWTVTCPGTGIRPAERSQS